MTFMAWSRPAPDTIVGLLLNEKISGDIMDMGGKKGGF